MFEWNYRVIEDERGNFSIREVHYMEDGGMGYTDEPSSPYGDDAEDLRADFALMKQAFDLPVLKIGADMELITPGVTR